ncbi:MAG: type VI secretion system lipoprotein TssJ [Kiloniellales bacterium]|nr:type VI secretion system lipoprotein TssJ [Kiloniellales bacterium]
MINATIPRGAKLAASLLALLFLAGCISDAASGVTSAVLDKMFEEGPTEIEANMEASDDVNPDADGEASPLVVRLYELKSPTSFNNATFFSLYDSDVAELGDDMKGKEEFELLPGEKLEIERELQPEVRYVGFMAGYRDLDNASWRAVVEVEEGSSTDITVAFQRLTVEIVEVD